MSRRASNKLKLSERGVCKRSRIVILASSETDESLVGRATIGSKKSAVKTIREVRPKWKTRRRLSKHATGLAETVGANYDDVVDVGSFPCPRLVVLRDQSRESPQGGGGASPDSSCSASIDALLA